MNLFNMGFIRLRQRRKYQHCRQQGAMLTHKILR
jgi:hypothetical protein